MYNSTASLGGSLLRSSKEGNIYNIIDKIRYGDAFTLMGRELLAKRRATREGRAAGKGGTARGRLAGCGTP